MSGERAPAAGAFENAQFIVDQITASNRSVFIVANIGLWYNDLELFQEVQISNFLVIERLFIFSLFTFLNSGCFNLFIVPYIALNNTI